jgi:hypothetical protein
MLSGSGSEKTLKFNRKFIGKSMIFERPGG